MAGVGRIEWPVAGTLIVVVVDIASSVINPRIDNVRIIGGHVRIVGGAWAITPIRDNHRGRCGTAPRLATTVKLWVLAGMDFLRKPRHAELDSFGPCERTRNVGFLVRHVG